jgi:site-specific recombinase XerD
MAEIDDINDKSLRDIIESNYSDSKVDLIDFVVSLQNDKSTDTIVLYMQRLAWLGKHFDPLADDPQPSILDEEKRENFSLEDYLLYAEKAASQRNFEGRRSRDRFKYLTHLSLKHYFRVKARQDKLEELPPSSTVPNPESGTDNTRLSEAEVEALVDAADSLKMSLGASLCFSAGLRIGELLWLSPSWIDVAGEDKALEIEIPENRAKGAKYEPDTAFLERKYEDKLKQFILQSYDCEDLEYSEFLEKLTEGEIEEKPLFVFSGRNSDEKSALQDRRDEEYAALKRERQRFNDNLEKIAKKASLNKDVTSHTFRRSIIKEIKESSDLHTAKEVVGRHNQISTTARYVEDEKEEKKDTYTDLREDS